MQRISSIRFLGYLELVFRANTLCQPNKASKIQLVENLGGEELQPIGYRAKDREHG